MARRSSPRFVRLMAKARAIVTDAGSTTGHMASLARELKVPTLLNTRSATTSIAPGSLITVDSAGGLVYAGEVPPLIERSSKQEAVKTGERLGRETPQRRFLEETTGSRLRPESDRSAGGFLQAGPMPNPARPGPLHP